jgi:hypothetical protein
MHRVVLALRGYRLGFPVYDSVYPVGEIREASCDLAEDK